MKLDTFLHGVEEIYSEHPAYERGHDGSDGKCDCIGLIKGSLRRGGVTPKGLKGTNYAARYTIQGFRKISNVQDLKLGSVVLKAVEPGDQYYDLPDEYKQGGANYNGDLLDYNHIGVVTRLTPLEITHMTSPTAKKDEKLGKWKYTGWLPQVDTEPGPGPDPDPPTPAEDKAKVWAPSGKTVNMRKGPSTSKALVERVPIGAEVTVLEKEPDWCQVKWKNFVGWMMTQFLVFEDPSTQLYTVHIPYLTKYAAEAVINQYPGSWMTEELGGGDNNAVG